MSLQCQNCGAVQPSGKFCPNCGGQMVPVVQAPTAPPPMPMQQQPAAAQMMPQPPRPASRTLWAMVAAIGGGVLVIGVALAFVFLKEDPTPPPAQPKSANVDPAKTEPAKTEPAKQPAAPAGPSKNVGGTALKLLGQGSFGARRRNWRA